MPGIRPRDLQGAGARGAARALAGGFCLALAVTVTQAAGVLPAGAQRTPTAAVAADTILAWGDNSFGQFGNGTTTSSRTPVAVRLPAGTTVTAIAGSDTHSLALTSAGTVLAWGGNTFGQLGDGTTTSSSTPVAVRLPAGTTVTAIAAGANHSLAITSTGAVFAWGENRAGQLGDGTTTSSSTPVAVRLPAGTTVTAIAGGLGHSLAVTSTGTTLAWGGNARGQLGDGTTTGSSTPITVKLPPATAVAAGDFHSLALTATDTVHAWGANSFGQLGDGSTSDSSTPGRRPSARRRHRHHRCLRRRPQPGVNRCWRRPLLG